MDLAYLYAPLNEQVFMRPPDGIQAPHGMVLHLLKSLYGLPRSGRNWNSHLHGTLEAAGFIRLQEDTCLYIRKQDHIVTIQAVYVDDLYIAATTETLNHLCTWLESIYKIKILGLPRQLLGFEIG